MNQRGSASITVVAGVIALMIIALALVDLGVFFIARARAQTAADAAALAAAAEAIPGSGRQPSEQARFFAQRNGGRLLRCRCLPGAGDVVVEVAVPADFTILGALGARDVTARARAAIELNRGDPRAD